MERKGRIMVLETLFNYCFLTEAWHGSFTVPSLKQNKTRIIQSVTNEASFFFLPSNPVYHPFPSCSLSSLCLRASSFIIRATLWEAIRQTLTQLPAILSRLQPHQASPLPAVTRMASHYDGSGLASCKIFIDAPLGPWELCTNTLTHSQTHLNAGNSQTKTFNCWSWSKLSHLQTYLFFFF